MPKKLLVASTLLKSHIDTYTRQDGTVVQAHEDKRIARQKAGFAGPDAAKYGLTPEQIKNLRISKPKNVPGIAPDKWQAAGEFKSKMREVQAKRVDAKRFIEPQHDPLVVASAQRKMVAKQGLVADALSSAKAGSKTPLLDALRSSDVKKAADSKLEKDAKIQAAVDRYMNTTIATSWSKPFAQRVEEEARRKAEGIGGDPGSEARLATLEAIVRTAKKRGWKAEHTSGSNSGRASSRYIEVPGRGVIRVSDHQLPMTPQREYNHSVGLTGRWSDELVVDDWDEMSIDDYMARLEHGVDWREHVGSLTKSYQPERRTILLIKACDFKRHSGFALYGNPAALA